MSYASQLASISRTPCTLVEIDLDTCSLTYGAGACTATGTSGNECYNTYPTCHDKTNFAKSTKTYQFTSIDTAIPFPGPRPYLSNTTYLATEIKDSSTTKARIKVDMVDEPDTDIGIDPYVANRTSVQGTFWKKLLARNPNYAGRPVRQSSGFITDNLYGQIPSDFVGHWSFDEGEGALVADSSDNNNDATASSITRGDGISGKAGIFTTTDSNNPLVSIPYDTTFDTQTFTITMWVKLVDLGANECLFEKAIGSVYNTQFSLLHATNDLILRTVTVYSLEDFVLPISSTSLTADTWCFIAASVDGANKNIYVNANKFSEAYTDDIEEGTGGVNIGSLVGHTNTLWSVNGSMDEVRFYNRALSDNEIFSIYYRSINFQERFAGTIASIKLSKGIVKIECVDLLASLSDFTIAAEVEAELNADITVDAVAMTLTDTDELTGSTGYGKLNDEIFYYGAKDDTTNTLSSLTRGMFGTTATTHDEGDSYQPVRYFEPDHPFDHLDTLIFTDAEIASARKNTSAWTQYRDFPETPGNIFSAIIHEPTKVSDLVWEIVDLMNLSLWQDEDQKISVRKNLANEPARTYTTITDTENIIINSGSVDLNPESRITRTILYWDRDAVADDGKTTSYNTIHIAIDADAEGANEYNDIVEDKIFCRWLRQGYIQSELVEDFAEMLVKRRLFQRRDAQEIITYRVELKDEATKTGDTIKLTTDEISEIDGTDLTEREYMVVKRTPKGGELEYKVKRMPRQKLCYIGDQFGAATLTGTDTDMSGSNNWSAVGGSLATFEVDGVTYPDKMYIEGNGAADFCWLGAVTVSGEIYKISLKARLATGASTTIRVGANITTAGSYIEITPTGTEQTFEGVISASGTTLYIGLATPGFSGVGFEIDDVQVWQQVDWAAASDSEKEYGFIADTAGNMDSTNKGYHIF